MFPIIRVQVEHVRWKYQHIIHSIKDVEPFAASRFLLFVFWRSYIRMSLNYLYSYIANIINFNLTLNVTLCNMGYFADKYDMGYIIPCWDLRVYAILIILIHSWRDLGPALAIAWCRLENVQTVFGNSGVCPNNLVIRWRIMKMTGNHFELWEYDVIVFS